MTNDGRRAQPTQHDDAVRPMPEQAEHYLTLKEVARRIKRATGTIRRMVREKKFPAPFLWGGGWNWLESDVYKWMIRNAIENEIDPDTVEVDEKKARTIVNNREQSEPSARDGGKDSSEKPKRG